MSFSFASWIASHSFRRLSIFLPFPGFLFSLGTPFPYRSSEFVKANGSSTTAALCRTYDTIDFAVGVGLLPCITLVRSPQSNGMAEAFAKTFKRDYVYVHDRPGAQTVLSQLPRSFEGYNEIPPHNALRLKSTRDFIRSLQQPAACPGAMGQLHPRPARLRCQAYDRRDHSRRD